jgi:hypothetical protein
MIEKGMTPPPLPELPRHSAESVLRIGIILVSLAVGFVLANGLDANRGLGVAAAIVGMLGVGNLVYYAIVRKRPSSLPPAA